MCRALDGVTLAFFMNPNLSDLSGLSRLEYIEGILQLQGNPALTTLRDLRSLQVVGGELRIVNTGITSFEGLGQLREVGGLRITENSQLGVDLILTSARGASFPAWG